MKNIYQVKVTIPCAGLVIADSEEEALTIAYSKINRLYNERDKPKLEITDMDSNWDDDYLLLNGNICFAEAKFLCKDQIDWELSDE